jgi:hypothetical protein
MKRVDFDVPVFAVSIQETNSLEKCCSGCVVDHWPIVNFRLPDFSKGFWFTTKSAATDEEVNSSGGRVRSAAVGI